MKNLEQLLEDLKTDEELRAKLTTAGKDEAAVNAVLAEAGYNATLADIKSYAKQGDMTEPTDEELRQVAGGDDLDVYSGVVYTMLGFLGAICWT